MIKRTVEISSGPTYLSIRNGQLVISREREVVGTIPCEDVGLVIVDHPAVTYTHGVLTTLMEHGAVLIACGRDHHPIGYVWPVQANTLHTERLRLQVECTRPVGKRIWQQIVRAKIVGQARNLPKDEAVFKKLMNLAEDVRSGDPSNVEAHAAKVYWKALFGGDRITPLESPLGKGGGSDCRVAPAPRSESPLPDGGGSDRAKGVRGLAPRGSEGSVRDNSAAGFHRDPDGPPPNNLLNYGYMAVRAAVARAICAAGLHPSIGFHHRNRYNAFCLADDLVEPLRPFVDARVRALVSRGKLEIDKDAKTELLGVLTETVAIGGESGPLLVALSKMTASLVRVMEGGEKKLEIPSACT